METKKINLFVFDTDENYQKSKKYLGSEGVTFKSMHRIDGIMDFNSILTELGNDEYVFMVVHVFSTDKVSGIKLFAASGMRAEFPKLRYMYISEGNVIKIQHLMLDEEIPVEPIYNNHKVLSELNAGTMKPITKGQLLGLSPIDAQIQQFDYAVITALYQDEFEELERIFEFPENEIINTGNKEYMVGYLKSDRSKKIVAAFQNSTGMVEAGIIAMHMLEQFKPKYLLMSGVCGGTLESNFGDIIVAKQVFTFQKGKLSDLTYRDENGEMKKIDIFTKDGLAIDYDQLYDNSGKKVQISIEKFQREHDSVIDIDSKLEDRLSRLLTKIGSDVNFKVAHDSHLKSRQINISILPMACSTMVINKEGYFEDNIKVADRKTAAVEMESYGVARACKFGNGGKTIPLIFKAVMDHTAKKTDVVGEVNWKKFAAFTSSKFLEQLFLSNVI
jgi:nucleoside phosphorylase